MESVPPAAAMINPDLRVVSLLAGKTCDICDALCRLDSDELIQDDYYVSFSTVLQHICYSLSTTFYDLQVLLCNNIMPLAHVQRVLSTFGCKHVTLAALAATLSDDENWEEFFLVTCFMHKYGMPDICLCKDDDDNIITLTNIAALNTITDDNVRKRLFDIGETFVADIKFNQ